MAPYVERLYNRLLAIVQTPDIPSSVTENAAIAIGRLGLGSCDDLAPHLESFARPFLDSIKNVAETDEKDTALRGFVMIVGRNPEAMESCLVPFFKCIAKYREPSPELHNLFQQVGYNSWYFVKRAKLTNINLPDSYWISEFHSRLWFLYESISC